MSRRLAAGLWSGSFRRVFSVPPGHHRRRNPVCSDDDSGGMNVNKTLRTDYDLTDLDSVIDRAPSPDRFVFSYLLPMDKTNSRRAHETQTKTNSNECTGDQEEGGEDPTTIPQFFFLFFCALSLSLSLCLSLCLSLSLFLCLSVPLPARSLSLCVEHTEREVCLWREKERTKERGKGNDASTFFLRRRSDGRRSMQV